MKNKHLLLISYVFPPYPGIGGRRWAKMAKYLAREGYTVHVLTAENPFEENSLWTTDVQHERIHVHTLPAMYPGVLLRKKLNLWDKLAYRYWVRTLSRRHRGSIYDRALAWQPVMRAKAAELIREHHIVNVIATGAPFRALYYATELKKDFPALNVIADLRDPWTAGKSYGFDRMGAEDKAAECALEQQAIANADTVLAPAPEILDDLRTRYGHDGKYVHLPHAFDPDDFSGPSTAPLFPADTISFAFTGTIYAGLEQRLEEMAAMLERLRQQYPEIYRRTRIDFYTADNRHAAMFTSVTDVVRFLSPLPPKKLYPALRNYRFALVLFTEQYKEFLSTKFWELFYLRLPVVYVGPGGRVAEFLRAHDLGLAFTGDQPVDALQGLLVNDRRKEFRFDIDTSPWSCEAVVKKLEAYFR